MPPHAPPPLLALTPPRPAPRPAERKSKRARKGRAPVTVDSTHTLRDLRLPVLEALGVHPANARLFLR